jgi:hypothetical protein
MSDAAPERIWAECTISTPEGGWEFGRWTDYNYGGDCEEYTRTELHTAALATYDKVLSAERKTADELVNALKLTIAARDARIAALEAGLRRFANVPARGVFGGGMTSAMPQYEDGSTPALSPDFPGRIPKEWFADARALLDGGKA